ncbi:hypothetical protein K9M78_00890 [Candidatus Bipolaricaulota bacterium]|nr:hypothetical protein [Candidatus Bipolaricaulota bacterium]
MDILAKLLGGIIGIGLGVLVIIPLMVMVFGSGVAVMGKIIESILG